MLFGISVLDIALGINGASMSETLTIALVAGGFAIIGSAVTGWFTYISAVKQREADRYKRRLVQAYKDIASFHRLEERYTKALETESKSAESWKREVRKNQRDEGFSSPSDEATSQKSEQRLSELS